MATGPKLPTVRELRAAIRIMGGDPTGLRTKAQLSGAIAALNDRIARPRQSPNATHDDAEGRRERVAWYLRLGYSQRAIVAALAAEHPPVKASQTTVSRDATEIRERWKATQVEHREAMADAQLLAWDGRLEALTRAWVHEVQAYEAQHGGRLGEVVSGPFGEFEPGAELAAMHLRSLEPLSKQILAIENARRDLMGLDDEESGSFAEGVRQAGEELGWPEDAIERTIAEAEEILRGGA